MTYMNREIKFRAWERNRMLDMDNILRRGLLRPGIKGIDLMQFTGLKDKNGKEIYEGDILAGHNPKYEASGGAPSIVEWDGENACFVITRHGISSGYVFASEVKWNEVIGNIYENPELLTRKEK